MFRVLSGGRRFLAKEHGATIVEYGLIVALLSIVAIAAIIVIGQCVNGAFTSVADELEDVGASKVP
jgi:pilus assembly protein Flp/PilA